jgi:pyruvate kinase
MNRILHRDRQTKIVATLGPASSTPEKVRALWDAGVDVFRFNFSHGTPEDHENRMKIVRQVEHDVGRPIAVLGDLQGPKLRVGTFAKGPIDLHMGQKFRLDLDKTPGDETRVCLPHPEIFAAIGVGSELLLDDGKVKLRIEKKGADFVETVVLAGTKLSDRKGVNVPDVVIPLSALTPKDRADLETALSIGVDWLALSFVQRPEDLDEARRLIGDRTVALLAKLEKPSAIESLVSIIEKADGVMVARGDLGVEMPPEKVPAIQKRIVREARRQGKPVIVATQMLESMISAPTPTRAEASDVATAVYDGADAIMLSAETASGDYPIEAVTIMNRIACCTQSDPAYYPGLQAQHPDPESTAADAITLAANQVADTVDAAAIITYTDSGYTTVRASRERPKRPILALTPKVHTARRMVLSFGVHSVHTHDISTFSEMALHAVKTALNDGLAKVGQRVVITAGVPFGMAGTTNVLRLAWVKDTEDPVALSWPT